MKDTSAVVTDPSGEIYSLCGDYLLSVGYKVKLLHVHNLSLSHRYNPLIRCNDHSQARKLASILVDSTLKHDSANPFWSDSAKSLISIILRGVRGLPIKEQHLGTVYQLLLKIGAKDEEIHQLFARNLDADGFLEYESFLTYEDSLRLSILATAKTALAAMSDPELVELLSSESLHFETLRKERTVIFVVVNEDQIPHYSFLLTIFYTQLFQYAMELPDAGLYLPIFFLMDEFGNMGRIPSFSALTTTLRKRLCSISMVLQEKAQLTHTYGLAEASTILNGGCANHIYYPGLGLRTCQEIEKTLGARSVQHPERPHELLARSLMTSEEIRTMKPNQALFISGSQKPVRLKTKAWFKCQKFVRRTKKQ